jgi:hypothetical protein
MKRLFQALFLGIFVVISAAAGILIYRHMTREGIFYEQAFKQLREGGNIHKVTIDFEAGGSASVILEHACCSGAGFDAVAVRTSDGQEYMSDENFCGLEGFRYKLDLDHIKSIPDFTAFLEQRGYKKR